MIKNKVIGKKAETFYSDIQCIDTKTPLDAIEKRLNSKYDLDTMALQINFNRDLLKKNHITDLDRKTREGKVDQLVERLHANKKHDNMQNSKASPLYTSKLQNSSTSNQSTASYNPVSEKYYGGYTNQMKNYDLKQSNPGSRAHYNNDLDEDEGIEMGFCLV